MIQSMIRAAFFVTAIAWPLPVRAFAGLPEPATRKYEAAIAAVNAFVAREVAEKKLPSLSIALVDDQTIVWSRGYGFADVDRKTTRHGRHRLPGGVGLQAVHRHRDHATRRGREDRPRCPGQHVSARFRPKKLIRRCSHHAPANDGPSLGAGPRDADRELFRPDPAEPGGDRRQPERDRADLSARHEDQVLERGDRGRRAGAGEVSKASRSRPWWPGGSWSRWA